MKHLLIIAVLGLAGTYAQTVTPVLRSGSTTPSLLDSTTRITFPGSGSTMLVERTGGIDTIPVDSIRRIVFDENGTVPVELTSFSAARTPDGVRITWHTASEQQNLGWHVLRSAARDGVFERIDAQLIPGAGTSAQTHDYAFTDTDAGTGNRYYRLQQIDTDGTYWYSWVISVTAAAGITGHAVPAPELRQNPARTFTFGITVIRTDYAALSVDRPDGTPVAGIFNGRLSAGRHRFTWPATDRNGRGVPPGTYLLRAQTGNGETTLTKLVVH